VEAATLTLGSGATTARPAVGRPPSPHYSPTQDGVPRSPARIRRQIACWPPQASLGRSVEEAGAPDGGEAARSGVRQTRR
jgi:hypothetical protein